MHNIKKILEELFELEPSLRAREKEVTKILTLMLESKPDIKMSVEFKKELRDKIMRQIANSKPTPYNFASGIKMMSTFLAGAVATYAALQFAVLPDFFTQPQQTPYESEVIEEKKEAFGDLKKL